MIRVNGTEEALPYETGLHILEGMLRQGCIDRMNLIVAGNLQSLAPGKDFCVVAAGCDHGDLWTISSKTTRWG